MISQVVEDGLLYDFSVVLNAIPLSPNGMTVSDVFYVKQMSHSSRIDLGLLYKDMKMIHFS